MSSTTHLPNLSVALHPGLQKFLHKCNPPSIRTTCKLNNASAMSGIIKEKPNIANSSMAEIKPALYSQLQEVPTYIWGKKLEGKALVRHLAFSGTVGSVTNMCSDKTGKLPAIKTTVGKSRICTNVKDVSNNSDASSLCPDNLEPAKFLLQSPMDNSHNTGGYVVVNKSGKNETLGTPTDTALLEFGSALGGDFQAEGDAPTFVKVGPFNSTKKKLRAVLELLEQGGCRAYIKAASEIILANSDKVINSNSGTVPLDEALVIHLEVTINDFAGEGLGTLCLDKGLSAEGAIPTSGYTCTGIVGGIDSVPPGINESVATCCSAGINGGATDRTNWVMCPR